MHSSWGGESQLSTGVEWWWSAVIEYWPSLSRLKSKRQILTELDGASASITWERSLLSGKSFLLAWSFCSGAFSELLGNPSIVPFQNHCNFRLRLVWGPLTPDWGYSSIGRVPVQHAQSPGFHAQHHHESRSGCTHLQSQHSAEGGGIRSSRSSSSATWQVWS